MHYLLLIHDEEQGWGQLPEQEQAALMQEYGAFTTELRESGAFVGANRLRPTSAASTVRVRDGETVVTDGPFTETKELIGGYWIIDVGSKQEAVEWASRCPAADGDMIEVRQVYEMSDFPPEVRAAAQ